MINVTRRAMAAGVACMMGAAALPAMAEDAVVIDTKVSRSLDQLFAKVPGSQELYNKAKGVLVMPDVTKAGLLVGGSYGEGLLNVNGSTVGYYSVASASFGLQAGVQSTKHAIFFMTTDALEKFRRADGWELGADAEFTVPGDGINANISTTTTQNPVIAIVFGQDGFMAGASLEGAKYSPIVR